MSYKSNLVKALEQIYNDFEHIRTEYSKGEFIAKYNRKKKIPPDEERCMALTSNNIRCEKRFLNTVHDVNLCAQHHKYYLTNDNLPYGIIDIEYENEKKTAETVKYSGTFLKYGKIDLSNDE